MLRLAQSMLFYSFFKSLLGETVVVELKNDLSLSGTLHSVDQFLNVKLTNVTVPDERRCVRRCLCAFALGRVSVLPLFVVRRFRPFEIADLGVVVAALRSSLAAD